MGKLEKALITLQKLEVQSGGGILRNIDPRCKLIVTLIYLVAVLSVPLTDIASLIWFFIFPITISTLADIPYGHTFRTSLWVLPFVAFIGLFNPIFDRQSAIEIENVVVSRGWITFTSIILRGILTMQGMILLIETSGFLTICRAMNRMGVPRFLTTQLMMVYRYISVLITETISMRRAREARGYGRKNFSLRMWGQIIGQLLLRTVDRAEHINRAMLARGFNGNIPVDTTLRWTFRDTFFLLTSLGVILFLYFFNITDLFQ